MHKIVKRAGAGAVLGGSLLFGSVAIASAAPGSNINDGLVNLAVGDASFLQDVNVDVASQIAGLLCGTGATGTAENPVTPNGSNASGMSANETNTNVRDITAFANQVDAGQIPVTTCESNQGVVTISQNGSLNTPNANTAPTAGPNAENIAGQPTGSQTGGPTTAPMAPTPGLTPTS